MHAVSGGLALQGNPWSCSCSNRWVGLWLRRWMRETLQLHTSGVERSHAIQDIVRGIKCDERANPSYATLRDSSIQGGTLNGYFYLRRGTSTQIYKSILSFLLRKGSKKHLGARKALEHGLLRPLRSSESFEAIWRPFGDHLEAE